MLAEKVFGDSGSIKVKLARSLFSNSSILRYTVSSYNPDNLISWFPDTLWHGGSLASDVFPGTPATFGGEINGYGQISTEGVLTVTEYTIFYVYDGIDPIVEYPATGSPLASYINAGGMHIGKRAGADSSWYHCDALGSTRAMTDEQGTTVTWSGTYYPFGEATTSGSRTNTHQFTGKEMDSEMGLNYFCQRYYDPQIGRFMSLDPFGGYIELPQSQNRYAYVMNNPLKYIDPLGLDRLIPPSGENSGSETVYDDEGNVYTMEYGEYWVMEVVLELVSSNVDFEHKLALARANAHWLRLYDLMRFRHATKRNILGQGRSGSGSSSSGGGGMPQGGGNQHRKFAIGDQWQIQATVPWGGFAWGQQRMVFPIEIRDKYEFIEENKGWGGGATWGIILAYGSGSWTGFQADMTIEVKLAIGFTFSYFENPQWKGLYIGAGLGPPGWTSGGVTVKRWEHE